MQALHDVNEAARLLAVSPWTIRAYIRQKKLNPIKFGRLIRLEESELQSFIAENRVGGIAVEPKNEEVLENA
jgi:excisionase family DNA binding protein